MTTYVLTGNCNIDQLGTDPPSGSTAGRTGGDVINTNGFTFTIDQDTRYGLGGGATLSLGSMTISATLGGTIEIVATSVRQIAYTGGTGNVPAYNTTVSQGSASGKLIRVQSAITATPTAPGSAMPASGIITLKQVSGSFTSGTLTGIGATSSGADSVGFIELVADEAATVTCNRLGTFRIRGAWYSVGTTSGSSTTTYQLPTNGSAQYYPGVQVETAADSGTYEWWPCAGSLTAANSTATDVRGRCCWITTGGVLRFGSDGTNTVGQVPPSGLRIRVPNILTANCTTAARGTNALPNATLGTRYDLTTTGGGVIDFETVNLAWYPSITQAYSVRMVDVGALSQISLSEVSQPMTLTRVCVGQEAANSVVGLSMTLCFAGGTFTDVHVTRAGLAASGAYIASISDVSGFTFNNLRLDSRLVKGNAGAGALLLTRAFNTTFSAFKVVGGKIVIVSGTNVSFTNTSYADVITGTTASTATQNNSTWEFATAPSNGVTMSGLNFFSIANVHPYLNVMLVGVAGCLNLKLRNIGTSPSSTLSLGSANQTGTLFTINAGAAASNVRVQRCFVSNTRTNLFSVDNSSTGILVENTMGDYADVPVAAALNLLCRSVGATPTYAAQVGVYGTHWWDHFTSATVGRIAIVMNEPTSLTENEVSLTNGAAFTSAGSLYMPTVGMTATFTMPHFAKGHTGFSNTALVMAGGTAGNYTYAYQIDTGSGFSSWSSELTASGLGSALNGLGSISPSTGFRLRLRITTSTANTTAITSVYVTTTSTATAQANYFPLDTYTLTLTGLQTASDVVIYEAGTTNVRASADSVNSFSYTYETPESVDIGVFKAGYIPLYVRNYSLQSANASLPIAQVVDRAYID